MVLVHWAPILLVVAAGSGGGAAGPSGVVYARLPDSVVPLAEVEVLAFQDGLAVEDPRRAVAAAASGPDGRFVLPSLPVTLEGHDVVLRFERQGFGRQVRRWTWVPGTVEGLVVSLEPVSGPYRPEVAVAPARTAASTPRPAPARPGAMAHRESPPGPLAGGRNDGLHHLFLVPGLEGASLAPAGAWEADLRYEVSAGRYRGVGGGFVTDLDGSLHEQVLAARLGVGPALELRGELPWASRAGSFRLSRNGAALLPSNRTDLGAADASVGVKGRLWEGAVHALAASMDLKLPTGSRGQVLSSGDHDVAMALHGTRHAGVLAWHVEAGWTDVGTVESLTSPLRTHDVIHGGLGLARGWHAPRLEAVEWVAQVLAQTAAFPSVAALDVPPVLAQTGVRLRGAAGLAELSLERGLSAGAADWGLGLRAGLRF